MLVIYETDYRVTSTEWAIVKIDQTVLFIQIPGKSLRLMINIGVDEHCEKLIVYATSTCTSVQTKRDIRTTTYRVTNNE